MATSTLFVGVASSATANSMRVIIARSTTKAMFVDTSVSAYAHGGIASTVTASAAIGRSIKAIRSFTSNIISVFTVAILPHCTYYYVGNRRAAKSSPHPAPIT